MYKECSPKSNMQLRVRIAQTGKAVTRKEVKFMQKMKRLYSNEPKLFKECWVKLEKLEIRIKPKTIQHVNDEDDVVTDIMTASSGRSLFLEWTFFWKIFIIIITLLAVFVGKTL